MRIWRALLYAFGVLGLAGGLGLSVLVVVWPGEHWVSLVALSYGASMSGFLLFGIFGLIASSLVPRLTPPLPRPAPVKRAKPGRGSELPTLFQQVKTYIDLEMWELAHDKARDVIRRFPDSREATLLNRNLNELRWKAEPKFLSEEQTAISREEEKELIERGLNQLLETVKTYMELEMWDLARQKAVAIMKNYPETGPSTEVARLFATIDRKVRESGAAVREENP